MFSFTSASSLLFLLSGVVIADVTKPLGLYTPRGFKTESIRAELEFLENDRVKYNIRAPLLDSKTVNSYSIAMVSSSLIRVTVDEQQQQSWEQFHPGQFSREGYTLFGYDPVKNRVTMVATGDAFEVLHESDPAKDAGPLTDVTKPSGVYRVEEGGLSMTMEFKQVGGNDRVHYHIKYGEKEYSSLLDPAFLMLSSSMVRVEILESDLFRLHGTFPGLSRDFFYMNLGYDPVANVITFVLDSYLGVKLVYSPTTTPTPTLPQTTAPPITTAPPTEQPFGDFCTSRGAAQFSVRFASDYTATVAGVMGDGRHFIARDALYDIHDNVVSVNVVNSDLYTILRRIDWFGLETLKFTYNPIDNRLFLAERGQNAQLFQLLGCAAPIENYSDGKLVVVDDDGEEDPKLDFPEAVMQAVQDVIDFIFGKD